MVQSAVRAASRFFSPDTANTQPLHCHRAARHRPLGRQIAPPAGTERAGPDWGHHRYGFLSPGQDVKYSIEASSSINTGVETTRSHLAD